ncbi:transcriptional regulator GutM [Aeribacillus composti]|uniref:Transcriptional regulator GutM n=1 Tax=Aeribacillus composti TaxID=1868734 RepID=A0ABY9WCI4_9BACI|nr:MULTISPECIES: transcriptional regulator GutM [Aeribacillus]MED0651798.1 transcriptional regulator GutM [Aeribacillus composti]MED4486332.1 transcriptional regulator GutM [Aeribacillus pallidus]WNF33585.1 transcriptional regulator GutM [Aeribacillus composti]
MKLAIILTMILLVQYVATIIQVRHYKKYVDKIVSRYKGKEGYFLYTGMNRRKFSSGAMAMIVVNKDYVIEDCYILKGISVFSKFKKYEKYIGHHVAKILDDHHEFTENAAGKKRQIPSFLAALSMAAENAIVSISKKKLSI